MSHLIDGMEGGKAEPLTIVSPQTSTRGGFAWKPVLETTHMERFMGLVAGAAVATALLAMVIENSTVVFVGGILSAIVGPYAYWQQTRLTDITALQETHKEVQAEVENLNQENQKLAKNVTELTKSVHHLEDVQSALKIITSSQGQTLETFQKQVEDNRKILKQMQINLKAAILQNLLSVILRADTDGDVIISDHEVEDLLLRIQNIVGVSVRESRFRQAIKGHTVQAVMEMVRNLLQENIAEDERIFVIQKQ